MVRPAGMPLGPKPGLLIGFDTDPALDGSFLSTMIACRHTDRGGCGGALRGRRQFELVQNSFLSAQDPRHRTIEAAETDQLQTFIKVLALTH